MSSPARKPLGLRLLGGAAAALTPRGLRAALRTAASFQLKLFGRVQRRVTAKVLAHAGRPADRRAVDAALAELADVWADWMTTISVLDPARPRVERRVALPLERIAELRAAGKGVILMTAHFGNPALTFAALGLAGVPVTILAADDRPFRWLSAFGLRAIPLGAAAVPLLSALSAGETVCVNADLEFFPDNRLVPFFGAPVRPPHALARLAQASGAPLLPVFSLRDEDDGWTLACDDPIWPAGQSQEALEWEILRSLERFIGERPGHWWLFQDVWNIQATEQANRRFLRIVDRSRAVDAFLTGRGRRGA